MRRIDPEIQEKMEQPLFPLTLCKWRKLCLIPNSIFALASIPSSTPVFLFTNILAKNSHTNLFDDTNIYCADKGWFRSVHRPVGKWVQWAAKLAFCCDRNVGTMLSHNQSVAIMSGGYPLMLCHIYTWTNACMVSVQQRVIKTTFVYLWGVHRFLKQV